MSNYSVRRYPAGRGLVPVLLFFHLTSQTSRSPSVRSLNLALIMPRIRPTRLTPVTILLLQFYCVGLLFRYMTSFFVINCIPPFFSSFVLLCARDLSSFQVPLLPRRCVRADSVSKSPHVYYKRIGQHRDSRPIQEYLDLIQILFDHPNAPGAAVGVESTPAVIQVQAEL